jgi:hypothetical protein
MVADDLAVLADLDAIGPKRNRGARTSTGRPRALAMTGPTLVAIDLVVVEANKAGPGDQGRRGMKAVEVPVCRSEAPKIRHDGPDLRAMRLQAGTVPTWFSTWPFSQPDAGVQATGSIRKWLHICCKRRL